MILVLGDSLYLGWSVSQRGGGGEPGSVIGLLRWLCPTWRYPGPRVRLNFDPFSSQCVYMVTVHCVYFDIVPGERSRLIGAFRPSLPGDGLNPCKEGLLYGHMRAHYIGVPLYRV